MSSVSASSTSDNTTTGSDIQNEASNTSADQNNSNAEQKNPIKIEDIDWAVDEGIQNGERYVMMNLTNNSDKAITDIRMEFTKATSVTDEQMEDFYSWATEEWDLDEDDQEYLRELDFGMVAETDKIINPGDSAENIALDYAMAYFYVMNIDHYSMVEPDIAKISFVDGDTIYTEYYDFKSGKYTFDDHTDKASIWSSTTLGEIVPKPDSPIIQSNGRDDEDCFMFKAYGMTVDDFNAYADSCKNLGFTEDSGAYEGFYTADNSDGYNVYLAYSEENQCMDAIITAPDEDEAQE